MTLLVGHRFGTLFAFSVTVQIQFTNAEARCASPFAEGCVEFADALQKARALTPPKPSAIEGAEFEGAEFWDSNQQLLDAAWRQSGRKHNTLYVFDDAFREVYLTKELRDGVEQARNPGHNETALRNLFHTAAADVHLTGGVFTPLFCQHLREEMEHVRLAGIPIRRPNGMNRYGAIMGDVGFQPMLEALIKEYLAPLGSMLFPQAALHQDIDHHYAFTVRYKDGEDLVLKEHADASVLTMNLCLGESAGRLRFAPFVPYGSGGRADNATHSAVHLPPGSAVFHHGQHRHAALSVGQGERTNLIIWLFAKWGTVRVLPYKVQEQMDAMQRWARVPINNKEL